MRIRKELDPRRSLALMLSVSALACPGAHAAAGLSSATAAKLFIPTNGVALSQFPQKSRLTTSVQIGLIGGASSSPVPWVAKSSATWLSVTHSGTTGTALRLTANPSGLTANTLYTATVTVKTAASASVQDEESVRVSFWLGSTDPGLVTVSKNTVAVAANPVDPWVYISDGTDTIYVYNVYSGRLEATFANIAPTVGNLVVNSDGTQLFAVDTTNYRIIDVNATTGTILHRYSLKGPIAPDFSFAYARPAGVETLFAPAQAAINVATGKAVSKAIGSSWYDPFITATPDGTKLAILERSLEPGSLFTYTVSFSGSELAITPVKSNIYITGENCQSMAMSPDGAHLYPACGWPYEFDVYNFSGAQVQTLPAAAYPDSATIDSNDDFVGGINGIYETDDIFVYNFAGYSVGNVPTTSQSYSDGQGNNMVTTSGDSSRVISATEMAYDSSQTLMFRDLP